MQYTDTKVIFAEKYINEAVNLIDPLRRELVNMEDAHKLLIDALLKVSECAQNREITPENEKAVVDSLRQAARLVESYYEKNPQEENAAGTIRAAVNEFESRRLENQDVTLKIKVSATQYQNLLDMTDPGIGLNDVINEAVEEYIHVFYQRQRDMLKQTQKDRMENGEMEVVTYTINPGEPSQYWGLKEKDTNMIIADAPNNWKTRNGAVRWAEKNGLKVVE